MLLPCREPAGRSTRQQQSSSHAQAVRGDAGQSPSRLLAYYDYPITMAAMEGTNNKIRTLQRQAYGFRDREFFKLRIYALHETKYASVG